ERRLRKAAEDAREAEQKRAEEAEARRRAELERAEAEARRADEAQARERDAEAAAERQKQLGRGFLIVAVVAVVLAAISFGLAVWVNKARQDADVAAKTALEARKRAEDQSRIAESRRLAALSEAERGKRLDRALILAVEALRKERTTEARDSLFRALVARPGIVSFLHSNKGFVESVAFSPDGKTLAAGFVVIGGSSGVVLWDAQWCTRLQAEPLPVAEGEVASVAFSPDGKTLAAGYAAGGGRGGVVLWDVNFETWKHRAGQIANRNLSLYEWRQIFPDVTYRPTFPDLPSPNYDERYKDIARNLTRAEWRRYFPDEPYRKTFDN
ncbi:MAG: hypothetical protein JO355_04160, partial [Planctomycetaceae bacterium]|nr:hypothetical protein [Planctomycetaceae bacterium]